MLGVWEVAKGLEVTKGLGSGNGLGKPLSNNWEVAVGLESA